MTHEELSESESKWFTLQTLSNQELKVKANIESIIKENKLDDVILEILIPSESVSEIKNGKKYTKIRKFYPGYVFILMKMYDKNGEILQSVWRLVRNAGGVIRFVGNNNPIPLKDEEINGIKEKMQSLDGKVTPKISHSIGDTVKINDGPFLNLTGKVEAIDTESGKLKVQVSMFGRFTSVDLEFWQVKHAEPEDR